MKILVVDDNADNLYMLEALLTGHGYEAISARDGAQALASLQTACFDLIISDILMPVMDGFQLCRAVREDERYRGIPFIFYTATYTSEKDRDFALSLGADRFIVKPADPDEFIGIIGGILHGEPVSPGEPAPPSLEGEWEYLRGYSDRLKEKLEKKIGQLEDSERRYRNLFNSLRDVVLVTDPDRTVLDANQPALRNTFGYEVSDILGRNTRMLYADDTGFRTVGKEVLHHGETGEEQPFEARFVRKDGTFFHGEINVMRLMDDDGMPSGRVAVIRDVTLHKKLEAQLMHAQKMEAVGRLAGGVAHDFNNKLSVILGYAEMSRKRATPGSEQDRNLAEIVQAAHRSRDITRQLLAFSRREVISPREIDLNTCIKDTIKGLSHLIGEDISIEYLPASDLWPVRLDPTQVDQILMNLAINARDAMPQGGVLRITTQNVHIDERYRSEHLEVSPGDYVQVSVSDTGCGIPPEIRERIFEPFFTTKETGKGTGLGLSTIFGIVNQNKGFINVYSEVGIGSTFTFYFPRVPEGERDTEVRMPAPLGMVSGTIMVVEDDSSVREMLISMLDSLGYTVIGTSKAEEAMSLLSSTAEKPDLILTDVVLPGISGREMTDRIAATLPGVPVLFMSGYASDMIASKGVLEKGVHFLQKPFDMSTLMEKLRAIIGDDGPRVP
jgi:PAS domain S-box-containing protein